MKSFKKIVACVFSICLSVLIGVEALPAYADGENYGFGVSPMKEKIILNPGETYSGSFKVTNPAKNTSDFAYEVRVSPFFATEDYNIVYEEVGDFNQIVNWVTVEKSSGVLAPNDTEDIRFNIKVPTDAPAGGQYVAIIVQSKDEENSTTGNTKNTGLKINQAMAIAHTIFAEVTGTTIHGGRIDSIGLSSFLMDGKITGTTTIVNTGNVHGDAIYKMQVYPLFSGEEIFTNEEDPETSIVLPNRTLHHESVWSQTPVVGIFNVVYTVEFEGVTQQISRLVIICPLWLLFIIIFAIVAIIVWLVIRIKMRKKAED